MKVMTYEQAMNVLRVWKEKAVYVFLPFDEVNREIRKIEKMSSLRKYIYANEIYNKITRGIALKVNVLSK